MKANTILAEDLEYMLAKLGPAGGRLEDSAILVTGCGGFLGYYLVHFFAAFADRLRLRRIVGVDNFRLGEPPWLRALARNAPRVEIRQCDVVGPELGAIMDAQRFDFIVHGASIASPTFYRQFPLETIDANVWGLRRLLDQCVIRPPRGLLFFSSSEVYGDPAPSAIPTPEDYWGNVSCLGPRACYDESKRLGETLCWSYNKVHGIPTTIVRPFNNYGPGMRLDDGRLPADFARAVVEGRDIVIFSDGTPTRTFCYVADAVAGYLAALSYGAFGVFNIGADKPELSVREVAEVYLSAGRKLYGYKGRIQFRPPEDAAYLTDNPRRRCPDLGRARAELGYRPEIELPVGVWRYLQHVREERAG